MTKLINLICPRCGLTQEGAWFNRKICQPCRSSEERNVRKSAKGRAWSIATKAIRTGCLIRQPCEMCGAQSVQAHHDDYVKPLEIRWLCRSCHRKHHEKLGEGKNALAEPVAA